MSAAASRGHADDRFGLRAYQAAGVWQADAFAEAVLDLVASIPPGRVMSYGAIAATLGSRASRQVGKVMAREGRDMPWWRVVHADGRPADGHEAEALRRFRLEGTPVRESATRFRVHMKAASWSPTA